MATENAVSAEEIKVNPNKMQISDTDVAIEIVGMHKWYGEFNVLKDIIRAPAGATAWQLMEVCCACAIFVQINAIW